MNQIGILLIVLAYLVITGYLGYVGYRRTKTTTDYLLAGREAHPYVMAMSYGATFISTSAIVGFGGAAALFGMSLLWLTFLNIFVGIFIACLLWTPHPGYGLQLGQPHFARTFGQALSIPIYPDIQRNCDFSLHAHLHCRSAHGSSSVFGGQPGNEL